MIRFDRAYQTLAIGVAALAGFVDAIGFVETAGFFVSFMTGNSTRFAVGVAEGTRGAAIAGGLIATFVAGVVAGSLVAEQYRRVRTPAVLSCATLLLCAAAGLRAVDAVWPAVLCLTLAMGVVNAAFRGRDGAVVGVTYMTGTLVQTGYKLANRLRGEGDARWWPHLALWAGLAGGAILGAVAVIQWGVLAYGAAIGLAAALTLRAAAIDRQAR